MRKIIVSVAPVAAMNREQVKNLLSPMDIAHDVIDCAKAGASMVHLHVRDLNGELTEDPSEFSRTLDLIREESDIIIQGSTGGVSELSLEERCISVNDSRVEVASLNMGSANFDDGVYINTLPDIQYWAGKMVENGVHPELEIFEGGMIHNSWLMVDEGYINSKLVFAFCLGFRGALQANAYNIEFLKGMLPKNSVWGLIHHDMEDLSLLVAAIGMGASFVRVGYEDSIYYAPEKIAKTNVELVRRITSIIKDMGLQVATVEEAREIIGINAF